MLSFPDALDLLLCNCPLMPVESCQVEDSAGRVLRAPVMADRAFPAFDRVMMDGYALRFSDWCAGYRTYRVTGSAPAGRPVMDLLHEIGTCLEVMTGAPCPLGADCIIPVEEVDKRENDWVKFSETADPVAGRFIHFAGSDATPGKVLLEPGQWIGSRQIGVAASCGAAWLQVSKIPSIAVVATGDELVAVDATPEPHQIRQSNAHSLAAALRLAGYPPQYIGLVNDDVSTTRPALEKLLAEHDWMVLTGAVSKGARDFVPSLLADLGCRKVFHGIAQRPGKPAGCWIGPRGQIILAFPGNPVSALTGLHTLLLPALAAASGLIPASPRRIVMGDPSQQLPDFTRHLPVTIRADGRAEPAASGNSGDFIGLLMSDGFITLPPSGSSIAAFSYTSWR